MDTEAVFGSSRRLLSLIETIYGAVDDTSLWPLVLDQISEVVRGKEAVLFTSFPDPATPNISCVARIDPSVLVPYADYYAEVNVLAQRCDQMFPDGTVRYSHRAVPDPEFRKTEFYNDYFQPNDMHYSFGLKVPIGDLAPAYISIMRPEPGGAFEGREGTVLETLMPHLQRALSLHLQFSQLRANAEGLESALDAFDHAVLGLDRHGKVVLSNRQAERLIQSGDGIKLSNGFLVATESGDNHRMQRQLADAVATAIGDGTSAGGSLLLNRRSGKPPLSLTVTPFVSHSLVGNYGQLAALVFIADPARRTMSRSDTLRSLYRLAPNEGRIADALGDGLDVAAISERIGFTPDTVRFYLKSIFRKTGVNRQSELLKLILRLPGI